MDIELPMVSRKLVFACVVFDKEAKKAFLRGKYQIIIAFVYNTSITDLEDVEIRSVLKYNISGSWNAHRNGEKILDQIESQNPKLFKYKNYNLREAYLKMIVWEDYGEGILREAIKAENGKETLVYRYCPGNQYFLKIKNIIWIFRNRFRKKQDRGKLNLKKFKHDITVLLFGGSQLEFLKNLCNGLAESGGLSIHILNSTENNIIEIGKENIEFSNSEESKPFRVEFLLRYILSNVKYYRILVQHYYQFANFIDDIECRIGNNTRAFVLNAMENSWHGHLVCEIAKKNSLQKIVTFNTMNGAKFGSANNANVKFDHWFVWSKGMRQVLEQQCKISADTMVQIDDHLTQDVITRYKYKNSLSISETDLKGKKVVSIFLSIHIFPETREVLLVAETLVEKFDAYIIIRTHPRFVDYGGLKSSLSKIPSENLMIINSSKQKSKELLYDQILLSNVAIVFASTVAYECKWFNVPAITYEKNSSPVLPDLDKKYISHAKNEDELISTILELFERKKENKLEPTHAVEKYVQYINNHVYGN